MAKALTLVTYVLPSTILGRGESHHDSYWIAEDGPDRVAFIGDLAFNGEHSNLSDAHTGRWLENLDRTREALSGIMRIYPGHGPAGGVELLGRQRLYLERYRHEVQKLANGRSTLTDADKARLTEQMTEYLPGAGSIFSLRRGPTPWLQNWRSFEVKVNQVRYTGSHDLQSMLSAIREADSSGRITLPESGGRLKRLLSSFKSHAGK
jgi:hypothetical protein